jgi:hypothetical protein
MKVAKTIIVIALYAPFVQALLPCRPQVSNRRFPSLVQLWASNTRKPLITGNWKMNPKTKQEAVELASGIAAAITSETPGDVAIFVPYPFIEAVQNTVGDQLIVGAEVSTAYTRSIRTCNGDTRVR